MSYKEHYDHVLNQYMKAVDGFSPNAQNQALKESILAKLTAFTQGYRSQFVNDGDVHKEPSMGVIQVEHHIEPQKHFFGSQTKSASVTSLSVFAAHKEGQQVIKGRLFCKVEMTRAQFGKIISRPNFGDFNPVTIVQRQGSEITYRAKDDASKNKLSHVLEKALTDHAQVERFLSEVQQIVSSAESSGRLGKMAISEIIKKSQDIPNFIVSNGAYAVKDAVKHVTTLMSEAKLNIHSAVNQASLESKE